MYRIEGSWGNFPAICRMGFFLGEGINLNSSFGFFFRFIVGENYKVLTLLRDASFSDANFTARNNSGRVKKYTCTKRSVESFVSSDI